MKLKLSFAAIAATTLASTLVLASAGMAQPCVYGGQGNTPDVAPSDTPSGSPTATQANFSNLNKMGIAGASLAVLGGLLTGGMMFNAHLNRTRKFSEIPSSELPPEMAFAVSNFAIEIPPEALKSSTSAEESDLELTSVR